jgi:hypothetical protein
LLILFVAVWFFPESPRWLVKVGREQEARYILQRLRGSSPEDRVRAEAEFQDIQSIAEMEKTVVHGNSYLSMLFGWKSGDLHIGRRVQLVIWLQIMQEWVGIAGVTVYAPTIFSIAGFDSMKSQWISGLNNIFYMVCRPMFPWLDKTNSVFPVRHAHLCVHFGSYWTTLDFVLGLCRAGHCHVPGWWILSPCHQRQG